MILNLLLYIILDRDSDLLDAYPPKDVIRLKFQSGKIITSASDNIISGLSRH